MIHQNDTSKGQGLNQNDKTKNTNEIIGYLNSPLEKTLYITAKKLEKIVAAIYLVTEVMDEQLSLTTTLRGESLALVSGSFSLVVATSAPDMPQISRLAMHVEEVAALVRIGAISHHISPMNADIITKELEAISKVLTDELMMMKEQKQSLIASPVYMNQPTIPENVIEDQVFKGLVERYESKRHQNDIKKILLTQKDNQNDIARIKATSQNDIQKIDRKQDVLNAIRSRGQSTIHDIQKLVPDCSTKTLQREVNRLVEMGVIRKEGNKRWTTYRAI